jgi:hypothetical protein
MEIIAFAYPKFGKIFLIDIFAYFSWQLNAREKPEKNEKLSGYIEFKHSSSGSVIAAFQFDVQTLTDSLGNFPTALGEHLRAVIIL